MNLVYNSDYTDWFEFFNKKKKFILLILLYTLHITLFFVRSLQAIEVYLQLRAHGKRVNLGLSNFTAKEPGEQELATRVRQTVRKDLIFTHFFDLIESESLPTDLSYWKNIGADALITGDIVVSKEKLIFTGKLIDLGNEEEIFRKTYKMNKDEWQEIAHCFSDDLVFRFTGEKGIAQTKIVFVNDAPRHKEVYTIDYDGENLQQVTTDSSIALLPRWVNERKGIVYTSYREVNPDIYFLDFNEHKVRPFSQYQGLNLAGSFSSDGEYVTATLTKDNNPEIYLLDRKGRIVRRVTWSKSIDIAPCFSPNNQEIVFVSDRSGNPQIFVTDIEGANLRRLTYRGYCDSPVWSPRGNLIAYTCRENENFQIYVIKPDGTGERKLTFFGSNENPSFSPDGRWIVFASNRNGRYELYRMSVDGSLEQRLADIPGNSCTPHWSP